MKVVCFGCGNASSSSSSSSRSVESFLIFACGCQVCRACHDKKRRQQAGCYFCKKPSKAVKVTEELPFALKKFLMPISYAASVYRQEITDTMTFQAENTASLREHLKRKQATSSTKSEKMKKLKRYVKQTGIKIKAQHALLKNLHKKIIYYERLLEAAKRARRAKRSGKSSSLVTPRSQRQSRRQQPNRHSFTPMSSSMMAATLNVSGTSVDSQFSLSKLNASELADSTIMSQKSTGAKSATSSIRNAHIGPRRNSMASFNKSSASASFTPNFNSTMNAEDLGESVDETPESRTMFAKPSVAKSGIAVNRRSFCQGRANLSQESTLSGSMRELVSKYTKK